MTTTFIKFSLQDKNGQAILGIDDGALQQSLIMEIKNPDFDRNIAIASLKEDKDYHFRLNFRPGTLLLSNLDKVTLSEKNRQEKWELKKDKDSFIFTYRGEKEIVLEPNAKNILIFTLENISAEPGGGARGTRVELEYQNLFYAADNKNPISGTLLQYINIVNQRGNQQIPLYIGFTGSDKVETQPQKIDVGNKTLEEGITKPQTISINNLRVVGSNRILNDGTPNELILTFRHLQKNPFQKKENEAGLSLRGTDKHKDAATNFKISFDVMPKESLQNIKKIGLDIRQLANNIVQQADNFLKSQDDSKLLQQQIELIAKKIEEVPTNKLASIPQAEVDSLTSVVEPVESVTVPLGVLNQAAEAEIIEKGTQQISQAILNLEELPLPVIKITEAIQDIKDASLNLDRLYKKLTDASQEKPPILTEIKAKAQSIHYPVKIILYWAQKLKEDPREALLCVTDASKVEIKFNQDSFTPDWEIVPNLQGASPQWTITRKTTATELTGEILRLEIKNLITILPAGYGNLYVYYENIPGYWDGYIICPVEKGPLMFRKDGQGEESLGIGTNKPEAKLHVVQKGLTNVAVFEGESGIAIKGVKGKHNALWITDAETEYPALYVEQKGKGEAAYFGGKVQIQGSLSVTPLTQQNVVNYLDELRRTKANKLIDLNELSRALGADISVYNGTQFVNDNNYKLYLSDGYLRIVNNSISEKFRSYLKKCELDYNDFNVHESQRTQIIDFPFNEDTFDNKLVIQISDNDFSLLYRQYNLYYYSYDYIDRTFYELLKNSNSKNNKNIAFVYQRNLEKGKLIHIKNGKKIIKQIFQETLNKFPEQDFPEVTVTKILINGKPLSDQEEILLIYDANTMQCRIEIFNKSLKESSFAKDQVYAVEWEKFAEDPSKVIAVKASKSSNRDNALGLDLGNSTGLKYDQTTSKLGIWVSSKEELQVVPNGINIPNGNVGIINGNVGIGTTNPQAKLHIEGTLRIGSSRSQESRQVNKIVIGDGECVQIGEWEENDILSIKAKRISLSVGSITPVTGGKMGLKNCQNNKYISCDGNFSWRDKLDTYENFTLEMSCSRELKENIVSLTTEEAISTITQLNAVKYDYKGEPAFRPNLGFIAEEMPDNLASADRKTLSPFEVIPVLTKVVQEQQRKIESLQLEVSELQKKLNQSEVHKEEG